MNELSPKARRLLELARHGDDPDELTVARVERQLAARIAGSAGAANTAASLAPAANGGARLSAMKALVTLGAIGGLAGTAWFGVDHLRSAALGAPAAGPRPDSAPLAASPGGFASTRATNTIVPARGVPPAAAPADLAPPGAPQVVRVEPSAAAIENVVATPDVRDEHHTDGVHVAPGARTTEAPDAHEPLPDVHEPRDAHDASSRESSPARVPSSSRPSATTTPEPESAKAGESFDSLEAEARALRAAQRALRSGDAHRALELLAQQDSIFRNGSLAEERFAARVLALCEAHEARAARTEAGRFERRYPASALLGKVRAACRDQ